jgi:hypothetical protein
MAELGKGKHRMIKKLNLTEKEIMSVSVAINQFKNNLEEMGNKTMGNICKDIFKLDNGLKTLDTEDATNVDIDASNDGHDVDASYILKSPDHDYYVGYLTGDGRPPNGAPYGFGITFPTQGVIKGQFYLRTDYFPNRLFRFNGQHWARFEDNVRMTLTNSYDANTPNQSSTTSTYTTLNRQTQRTGFINNNNTATIAGVVVQERQALSKVLKPKADN